MNPQEARRQAGVVGGVEVLPFGLLIFVVGALLIANAWAVIDTKMATSSAAREAARTYVEAPDASAGAAAADRAGRAAIENYGRPSERLVLTIDAPGAFIRCTRATVVARYEVPAISLPFGLSLGDVTVTSRHTEIVDPLRTGLGKENTCGF